MNVIIVGGGQVGCTLAEWFVREKHNVTIVDINPDKLQNIGEYKDVRTVVGRGSSPEVLDAAGINSAEVFLAVTDSDEANVMSCLMSDSISPATLKIARIRDIDYHKYVKMLERAGVRINLYINPERIVVNRIKHILKVPGASDVTSFAENRVLLATYRISGDHHFPGKSLSEIGRDETTPDTLVVGLQRDGKIIIPTGKDIIQSGDIAYLVLPADKTEEMAAVFSLKSRPIKRIFIHGGDAIGYLLARDLEEEGYYVKVIEPDPQRCLFLSEKLSRSVILQGEGSDLDLLKEENIAEADVFISLTNDQDLNICSALLAKRLGANLGYALIDRPGYAALAAAIGVDVSVSPRLLAVSSILHFIRRGSILAAADFLENEAEAIEIRAMETSRIIGCPLREAKLPGGSIVGAIVRGGEVVIPNGDSIIKHGDRVIIFALRNVIRQIEKSIAVSIEYF